MSAMSSPGVEGAWSYRTGPWFAAFGPRVSVLLPESQRDQVIGVWSLVDGGAGFDEVLDALLASGLSRLPGFVLVSTDEGPTRVLLRGTGVSASLTTPDEQVVLDGSAGATWVERSVEGVTGLSVVLAEADGESEHAATDFPILTGLVRVARIDRPPYAASAPSEEADSAAAVGAAMAGATAASAGDATTGDTDSMSGDAALGGAVTAASFGASGAPASAMGDEPVADEEVLEPAMAEDATAEDEPAEPAADEATADEAMTGAVAEEQPAALDEPSPYDEPAPFDEPAMDASATDAPAEPVAGPATEPMMPLGGDPLTDPMPPEQVPSDWVTPWGAPPPPPVEPAPPAPPVAEESEPAAMADESAPEVDEPVPMTDQPMTDEPVTEVAPPSYSPPPPPVDSPAVDLPPPPLPVGSWEPIGSGYPPPTPAAEPQAPPAPLQAASEPVAKLMISDGQQVLVDRVILIGRAPEARRFTSTEQPHLVTVPSRLHEISSTHVEVRPGTGADHGSAVVTDMGSTNGTVLVQPGQGPEDLKPGIAVQLAPGAIINLGDGITIQVTRP